MRDLAIALGRDLHVRETGAAARTPRHRVGALVQPAAFVADLEEVPDRVVILVRLRVVRVVPVHPEAEPLRLLRDHGGEAIDARLALLDEAVDAVLLDIALRAEAEFLLDLDLDPQPLAVEAVLVALAEALHRAPAQEQVLVHAPPRVVDAHRVVGRDRAIDEGVALLCVVVARQVLLGRATLAPLLHDLLFLRDEIDAG